MTEWFPPEPIPSPLIDPDTGAPAVKYGDLSCTDDIALGYTHGGEPVTITLVDAGHGAVQGAAGSGKSNTLNTLLGHAVLMEDVQVTIIDGSPAFEHVANVSLGPTTKEACEVLRQIHAEIDKRRALMVADRADEITEFTPEQPLILLVIEECAMYTAAIYDAAAAKEFRATLVTVMERGHAVGVRVWLAGHFVLDRSMPNAVGRLLGTRISHRVETGLEFATMFGTSAIRDGLSAADRAMHKGEAIVSTPKLTVPQRMRVPRLTLDQAWAIAQSIVGQRGSTSAQSRIHRDFDDAVPEASATQPTCPVSPVAPLPNWRAVAAAAAAGLACAAVLRTVLRRNPKRKVKSVVH